jgi:hypothetical protein
MMRTFSTSSKPRASPVIEGFAPGHGFARRATAACSLTTRAYKMFEPGSRKRYSINSSRRPRRATSVEPGHQKAEGKQYVASVGGLGGPANIVGPNNDKVENPPNALRLWSAAASSPLELEPI